MESINAIEKVRFSSAKAQRVHLFQRAELLCFEPDQEISVQKGSWRYYVIAGTVTFAAGEEESSQASGHLVQMEPGQKHLLANRNEVRGIVLALRSD